MGSVKRKTAKKTEEYNPDDWDESKSVEVAPEPKLKSGISTSIRLPKEMVARLRKIARKKGDIGYQTLIKIWIAERLEEESKKVS
jgi:hypothetical protein